MAHKPDEPGMIAGVYDPLLDIADRLAGDCRLSVVILDPVIPKPNQDVVPARAAGITTSSSGANDA